MYTTHGRKLLLVHMDYCRTSGWLITSECIFRTPSTMKISHFAQAVAALTFVFSGAANATIPLSGEYSVTSFASGVGANTWQFDYSVTNNNQGMGGFTGLDGFTIFIPESATVIDSTSPAPFNGAPGFWSVSIGTGLDLQGNGSASLFAPAGFKSFTWWGSDPSSVYTVGSTAVFSVTLGNVSVGSNTVGITTYFGGSVPAQEHTQNQWGNYSTIIGKFTSPVSAVPEPETYAMMLAGLALIGGMARRRRQRGA